MAATNAGFVNINSDLGESFGPWVMGNDVEVLKIVKSANVACGFHASDPTVMVDTVKLCQQNGVSIGAHPGFADLQGFGRRVINLSVKELEANIAYQLGALQAIAAMHGVKVTHMKPHGMMGNMSAESADMSEADRRSGRSLTRRAYPPTRLTSSRSSPSCSRPGAAPARPWATSRSPCRCRRARVRSRSRSSMSGLPASTGDRRLTPPLGPGLRGRDG